MADFATSRHRQRLNMTRKDLDEKYKVANERAVQMLHKYGATRMDTQPDGVSTYAGTEMGNEETGGGGKASLPVPLTVDEESLIRRFYEQKIQQVCAAFSFPNKIQATAITYFKRFYLHWSVMEHDPKHIMLTCIYLSCKAEEFHVSAEELGKGIQQDPQVLLKNEMAVLLALDFELIVYGPYRSLEGFAADIENSFSRGDENAAQNVQEIKDEAVFVADSFMLTDAPLLFSPGQLALAALLKANQIHGNKVDLERYCKQICERQSGSHHTHTELKAYLDAIHDFVENTRQPIEEEVKRIDRKLKYCRNPELQDGNKKRDRKSKQKPKRPSQDLQTESAMNPPAVEGSSGAGNNNKRRRNEHVTPQ